MKILLIEDDRDTLEATFRLLMKAGHQVTIAVSCVSAIHKVGNSSFDIVLCDLGLPDGDGCDLLADLRKLRPIIAISISGYAMPSDYTRSQAAGFHAHISKPFDSQNLLQIIDKLCSTHPLGQCA